MPSSSRPTELHEPAPSYSDSVDRRVAPQGLGRLLLIGMQGELERRLSRFVARFEIRAVREQELDDRVELRRVVLQEMERGVPAQDARPGEAGLARQDPRQAFRAPVTRQ